MKKILYLTILALIISITTTVYNTKTTFAYEIEHLENEVQIIKFDNNDEMKSYQNNENYSNNRRREITSETITHKKFEKDLTMNTNTSHEYRFELFIKTELEVSNDSSIPVYFEYYRDGQFYPITIPEYSMLVSSFDIINNSNYVQPNTYTIKYKLESETLNQNKKPPIYPEVSVKVIEIYKPYED